VGRPWAWYPVDKKKMRQALSRHEKFLENIILNRTDIFKEAADGDNFALMAFSSF